MRKYGPWVLGDDATTLVYSPEDEDGAALPGLATATEALLIGKSPTTKENLSVPGSIVDPTVTFADPLGDATMPGAVNRDEFVCRVKITLSSGAVSWSRHEFILSLVRFPV
jgi:hypothetical protein